MLHPGRVAWHPVFSLRPSRLSPMTFASSAFISWLTAATVRKFALTVALIAVVLLILGVVSIWFETPRQLSGALGLVDAGVAIALQRVITAFAAYLIILRGRVFTVGDRIVMAGVRSDVIALGFMQTMVMEMGQLGRVRRGGAWFRVDDLRDRRVAAGAI